MKQVQDREPAARTAPLHRKPFGLGLLTLLLALALAACSAGGTQTPGDDGRVDPLPPDVPVGTDPGDGTTTCVVTDRTFDDNVTVPADLHCVFYNVIVEGNLVLSTDSRVEHWGGHVDGDVQVYTGAEYRADFGELVTVGGNVQADGAAAIRLTDATVDGDVQSLHTPLVEVVNGSVDGNIQNDRGGAVTITGVTVNGNIQPLENGGMVTINDNVVNGDVQPKENTGGVTINDNEIDGNLQCESNDPAPTGGGNVVQGDAEGQCSALAA